MDSVLVLVLGGAKNEHRRSAHGRANQNSCYVGCSDKCCDAAHHRPADQQWSPECRKYAADSDCCRRKRDHDQQAEYFKRPGERRKNARANMQRRLALALSLGGGGRLAQIDIACGALSATLGARDVPRQRLECLTTPPLRVEVLVVTAVKAGPMHIKGLRSRFAGSSQTAFLRGRSGKRNAYRPVLSPRAASTAAQGRAELLERSFVPSLQRALLVVATLRARHPDSTRSGCHMFRLTRTLRQSIAKIDQSRSLRSRALAAGIRKQKARGIISRGPRVPQQAKPTSPSRPGSSSRLSR